MHSIPSLQSFPNLAFEKVPTFIWLLMALSCPFKEDGPYLQVKMFECLHADQLTRGYGQDVVFRQHLHAALHTASCHVEHFHQSPPPCKQFFCIIKTVTLTNGWLHRSALLSWHKGTFLCKGLLLVRSSFTPVIILSKPACVAAMCIPSQASLFVVFIHT